MTITQLKDEQLKTGGGSKVKLYTDYGDNEDGAITQKLAKETKETHDTNLATLNSDVAALTTTVGTIETDVANKVDKVTGKGLSTNDYTDADKSKLNDTQKIASVGDGLSLASDVLSAKVATSSERGSVVVDSTLDYTNATECIGADASGKLIIPTVRQDLDQYSIKKNFYGAHSYNGTERLMPLDPSEFANRDESADLSLASKYTNQHICANTMDRAVKAALTDGVGTAYTETEKAAARTRVDAQKTITVTDTDPGEGTPLDAGALVAVYEA